MIPLELKERSESLRTKEVYREKEEVCEFPSVGSSRRGTGEEKTSTEPRENHDIVPKLEVKA